LAQDCHTCQRLNKTAGLGFPEFESIHSTDFSVEAQISKSVASTIPPRPLRSVELYSTTKWKRLQHPKEILMILIAGDDSTAGVKPELALYNR